MKYDDRFDGWFRGFFFIIIMIYVRYTSVYVHLPCVLYIGNTAKIKYDYKFVFILTFFFRTENGNIIFLKINFNPTLLVQNIVSF